MNCECVLKNCDIILFLVIITALILQCFTELYDYISLIIVVICTLGFRHVRWKKIVGIVSIFSSIGIFCSKNTTIMNILRKIHIPMIDKVGYDVKKMKLHVKKKINVFFNIVKQKKKLNNYRNKYTLKINKLIDIFTSETKYMKKTIKCENYKTKKENPSSLECLFPEIYSKKIDNLLKASPYLFHCYDFQEIESDELEIIDGFDNPTNAYYGPMKIKNVEFDDKFH